MDDSVLTSFKDSIESILICLLRCKMFFNSFINWKAKKKFLILKEKIQKFNQIN